MDIAGKLQIKSGERTAVVGLPDALKGDFTGFDAIILDQAQSEIYQTLILFAVNSSDLSVFMSKIHPEMSNGLKLWIGYPKAKALGTDLHRDILHPLMSDRGWEGVRLISVDETWSAMRFKSI